LFVNYGLVRKTKLNLAKVKKGDQVADFGSDDGRIVIEAARNYGAISTTTRWRCCRI